MVKDNFEVVYVEAENCLRDIFYELLDKLSPNLELVKEDDA